MIRDDGIIIKRRIVQTISNIVLVWKRLVINVRNEILQKFADRSQIHFSFLFFLLVSRSTGFAKSFFHLLFHRRSEKLGEREVNVSGDERKINRKIRVCIFQRSHRIGSTIADLSIGLLTGVTICSIISPNTCVKRHPDREVYVIDLTRVQHWR